MRNRRVAVTAAATAITALLTMGATDCQAPEPDAGGESQAGKSGEVSVPIKVTKDGWGGTTVLVPIRINGRGPYNFVLDTGAAVSMIDRSLSRRLALPETGETVPISGVAGDADAPVVTVRRWSVGGQRLRGREMPALDLGSDVGAGSVYVGLLGSDELRRFGAVRLDYKNRRLVLRAGRHTPTRTPSPEAR
jgi:predicted aspartyl protease